MWSPSRRVARLVQIIAITGAGFVFSAAANAQVPTSGNVFFGYSYYNTELSSIDRAKPTNGWEAIARGQGIPFLGLVAGLSHHYGSQDVVNPGGTCAIGVVCSPLHASTSEQTFCLGRGYLSQPAKCGPLRRLCSGWRMST